jgi:hypothetical protein
MSKRREIHRAKARDGRRSSTARPDRIAGAGREEKASACSVRNDGGWGAVNVGAKAPTPQIQTANDTGWGDSVAAEAATHKAGRPRQEKRDPSTTVGMTGEEEARSEAKRHAFLSRERCCASMIMSPFVLDRNVPLIRPPRGGQIEADRDEQERVGTSGSACTCA